VMPKFIQTLRETQYAFLKSEADKRGITLQELIRAVIVPSWVSSTFAEVPGFRLYRPFELPVKQ